MRSFRIPRRRQHKSLAVDNQWMLDALPKIRQSKPESCAQAVDIVDIVGLVDEANKKTCLSGEVRFVHKVHDIQM